MIYELFLTQTLSTSTSTLKFLQGYYRGYFICICLSNILFSTSVTHCPPQRFVLTSLAQSPTSPYPLPLNYQVSLQIKSLWRVSLLKGEGINLDSQTVTLDWNEEVAITMAIDGYPACMAVALCHRLQQ